MIWWILSPTKVCLGSAVLPTRGGLYTPSARNRPELASGRHAPSTRRHWRRPGVVDAARSIESSLIPARRARGIFETTIDGALRSVLSEELLRGLDGIGALTQPVCGAGRWSWHGAEDHEDGATKQRRLDGCCIGHARTALTVRVAEELSGRGRDGADGIPGGDERSAAGMCAVGTRAFETMANGKRRTSPTPWADSGPLEMIPRQAQPHERGVTEQPEDGEAGEGVRGCLVRAASQLGARCPRRTPCR